MELKEPEPVPLMPAGVKRQFAFHLLGFPGGSGRKESACNVGDPDSIRVSERPPWRREWLPTPVFLPGEFHGHRSWWATVHGVAQSWT